MFFKKKKKINREVETKNPLEIQWEQIGGVEVMTEKSCNDFFNHIFQEPQTNATIRLKGNAKDFGSVRGIRSYNSHIENLNTWKNQAVSIKTNEYRSQNQWININQSVNTGFSSANLSYYLFQTVNYYDCMTIGQDPLMSKVLSILSETPFSKGGEITNLEKEQADELLDKADKFKLNKIFIKALRSTYSMGGCLLYIETDDADLSEPLDLKTYDCRKIKNFIQIDPINISAVNVNTSEPARTDYMNPSMWYVVGLGVVHSSRFLKFEDNVPESLLRPLCMYFGTPLTNLIKQDIANTNLATQGLANLINRSRYLFLRTDDQSYTTGNIRNFNARLRVMSQTQDNFMFTPLKSTEDVSQQTMSLSGFAETTEFLYTIISAKTSIPVTQLLGVSASGMNATGEGDRRQWYDKVEAIRSLVKDNYEIALGIIAGKEDGIFKEIHYTFNPLETPNEKEIAEINKLKIELAKSIVELGGNTEQVFDWLKKDDLLKIDTIDIEQEQFLPEDFSVEEKQNENE